MATYGLSTLVENRRSLLATVLASIASMVPLTTVFLLVTMPAVSRKIDDAKHQNVQTAVDAVYRTFEFYETKATRGELSSEAAKKLALDHVKSLRYAANDYFWINDTRPHMVMHPMKPDMDGQDLSQYTDPNGTKLFVEAVRVTSAKESGFIDYMWPKPGQDKPVPKLSYVKIFKPWGWIIGSGVYVDDVQTEIRSFLTRNMLWFALATLGAVIISIIVAMLQLKQVVMPVRRAVSSISSNAAYLTETAENFLTVSNSLSEGANKQIDQLHATTAAVTEINETSAKTAQFAEHSNAVALSTSHLAKDGQQNVTDLMHALSAIATSNGAMVKTIKDANGKFLSVAEVIKAIEDKTQAINDIVFQTKLLSFNASIEAARAGEHGKGFAVVAEEIGNLASLSGKSALEINGIIRQSAEQVAQIVQSIDSVVEKLVTENVATIHKGQAIGERCQASLGEVVSKAEEASNMSSSMLQAIQEQVKGIREISNAISIINDANQQSLHHVSQSVETSHNLLDKAQGLDGLVQDLRHVIRAEDKKAA